MGAAKKGLDGQVAAALWQYVADKPYTHVPGVAIDAANDLIQLYVDSNPGQTQTLREIGGDRLVSAVMRGRGLPGIRVPTFTIKLEGNELVWEGSSTGAVRRAGKRHRNPCSNPHHERTLAEVREILAGRTEKCFDTCAGWGVFDTDKETGPEIQVCDECMSYLPKELRLTDDDVAQIPEAQLELAKALEIQGEEGTIEINPPPQVGDRVAVGRTIGNVVDVRGSEVKVAFASGGAQWQPLSHVRKLGMGLPPGVPQHNPRKSGWVLHRKGTSEYPDDGAEYWSEKYGWGGYFAADRYGVKPNLNHRLRAEGEWEEFGSHRELGRRRRNPDLDDIEEDLGINPRRR